jgi:hypothetical protein
LLITFAAIPARGSQKETVKEIPAGIPEFLQEFRNSSSCWRVPAVNSKRNSCRNYCRKVK